MVLEFGEQLMKFLQYIKEIRHPIYTTITVEGLSPPDTQDDEEQGGIPSSIGKTRLSSLSKHHPEVDNSFDKLGTHLTTTNDKIWR